MITHVLIFMDFLKRQMIYKQTTLQVDIICPQTTISLTENSTLVESNLVFATMRFASICVALVLALGKKLKLNGFMELSRIQLDIFHATYIVKLRCTKII